MRIIVHCHLYLNPDAKFDEEIGKMIKASLNDKGCKSYVFVKECLQENHFMVIEEWESKELLDEHMKQPHFVEFGNYIKTIALKDLQIEIMEVQ